MADMASPGRAMTFVLCVLLAGAGCIAGFAIARVERDPAPSNPTNEAVLAEVRALAEQIARLESRLAGAHAATTAPVAPRESAPSPAEASPRAEPVDEDRLLRLVLAALAALPRGDDDALRQARLQNPQPNAAAVTDLHARLAAADQQPGILLARQREWLLLGMADVVRKLGMPDQIIKTPDGQLWEYHLSDSREIYVHFQNGVVVLIST